MYNSKDVVRETTDLTVLSNCPFQVNGEDVTTATHGHVVDLIKKGRDSVTLKIVTVNVRKPSINGTDHTDGQGERWSVD